MSVQRGSTVDGEFDVTEILKIRKRQNGVLMDKVLGDSKVRPRVNPTLNQNAKNLKELLDWSQEDHHEPSLTCKMTVQKLKELTASPMTVPKWPSHTQSVERIVKMVTEAAAHVYSQERRNAYIRGSETSAELMPKNKSKQDVAKLTGFKKT